MAPQESRLSRCARPWRLRAAARAGSANHVEPAARDKGRLAVGHTAVACQREGTRVLPRPRDHLGRMVMVMSGPRPRFGPRTAPASHDCGPRRSHGTYVRHRLQAVLPAPSGGRHHLTPASGQDLTPRRPPEAASPPPCLRRSGRRGAPGRRTTGPGNHWREHPPARAPAGADADDRPLLLLRRAVAGSPSASKQSSRHLRRSRRPSRRST